MIFLLFISIFIFNYVFISSNSEYVLRNDLTAPKIIFDIPTIRIFRDSSFSLNCSAVGNPSPTIKWFRGDKNILRYNDYTQILKYEDYSINPEGGLKFLKKSSTSSNTYFCSATNVFGIVFSKRSEVQKISFNESPKVTCKSVEILPNDKAIFHCEIDPLYLANEYVIKRWEIKTKGAFSETVIKTEGRYSVINVTEFPQLHIRNVSKEELGQMQVKCVLENKFSSDLSVESEQWAEVKYLQDLSYQTRQYISKCPFSDISVLQGTNVELPWCKNYMPSTVRWFRSNVSNQNGYRVKLDTPKFSKVSERDMNLLIRNVQIEDEGVYFVKEDNVEQRFSTFGLKVAVKIGITITPSDQSVAVNKSVRFRCVVTGRPKPDIFWLHNGVYRDAHSTTILDAKTTESVIIIKEVDADTAGVYQCVAESMKGAGTSTDRCQQSVSVMIKEMPPRLFSQMPALHRNKLYATAKFDSAQSPIKIQCLFKAIPNATIVWYLDDDLIQITAALTTEISKQEPYTIVATLKIDLGQLSSIDENWKYGGMYVARATNAFGAAECKTLVFIDNVLHIRNHNKMTLNHGQQFTMKCYVISSDIPQITWSTIRDGVVTKFPLTHLESESQDRREIFIQNVDKTKHEAVYECSATLGKMKESRRFNISVTMPPRSIRDIPIEEILYQDSLTESFCEPTGHLDTPWYSWWEFQNFQAAGNKSVIIDGKDSVLGVTVTWNIKGDLDDNSQLPSGVPPFLKSRRNVPSKIQVRSHEGLHMGNLTCVVQNSAGILRKGFRIIIAVLKFEVEPPTTVNVTLGNNLTLHCSPKANRLITTTIWQHNGGPVPLYHAKKENHIFQFVNGTLRVTNISDSDREDFLCMIQSNSTRLKISKMVKISLQVPARILGMPENVDLVKRSNHDLVCQVFGDSDHLQITWQKFDNVHWMDINNAVTKSLANKITLLSLHFLNSADKDVGVYKCVTRNMYSTAPAEKTVRLAIVDIPGGVKIQLEKIKKESRSIWIDWFEPTYNGNKPILNYQVSCTPLTDCTDQNVTMLQVRISALRPNHEYNISIRARNEVGLGEEELVFVKTLEAVPDGEVLNISVHASSSTSLVLSWEPPHPLFQNGKITSYNMCYQQLQNFSSTALDKLIWSDLLTKSVPKRKLDTKKSDSNEAVCEEVNSTKIVLSDLPKFTAYAFRVAPVNAIGMGPFAYTKNRTLDDNPEKAPIDIVCSTKANSMTLKWNPPPQDSINGVLKNYMVKYFRPEHYGSEEDGFKHDVLKTNVILEGLIAFSNYSVQVAVLNEKGQGPLSAPLICATTQGKPSAPEKLKALSVNRTCIFLIWAPPARPNGPLLRYCIESTAFSKEICLPAKTTKGYFTKYVCGLSDGQEYVFEVTAHNMYKGDAAKTALTRAANGVNKIVSIPGDITVTDRATIVLDCETIRTPDLLRWYHNPSKHSPAISENDGNYKLESNGSLTILSSSNSSNGRYECTLPESEPITYTVSVKIVANGTPSPPQIYYHNSSLTSVFISWRSAVSPRSDDPITSFYVRIKNDISDKEDNYTISPTHRSLNISNLICGTSYTLHISAVNRIGQSRTENLSTHTLGTRPQWANSSRLVTSSHPKSLCFKLAEFLDGQGCPPDRYEVKLKPHSQNNGNHLSKLFNHNQVHVSCNNVTGLNPQTGYTYTIEASNNAGNSSTSGYAQTLQSPQTTPFVSKIHGQDNFVYLIVSVLVILFIVLPIMGYVLYRKRRQKRDNLQPGDLKTNDLHRNNPSFATFPPLAILTPSTTNKNRKLPALPTSSNPYDSGIATVNKGHEEEEAADADMIPYATYEPTPASNTGSQQGKKNLPQDQSAYIGSQAHSYQYPDMVGTGPQQPTSSIDMHQSTSRPNESYDNSAKQPLLSRGTVYNKGYSVGVEARSAHSTHLPPRPPEPNCQEQYRPGGSTWSNTTGSSTKELNSLFPPNYGVDHKSGLREKDDCSTTRAVNQSTLLANPIRGMLTDPHESYFESSSSGDDPGIQKFTQERFHGLQVIEPKCTHPQSHPQPHPSFARQSSSDSSTYDSVDAPMHRTMGNIPFGAPIISVRQLTLTEEDESDNYQNKFVIV